LVHELQLVHDALRDYGFVFEEKLNANSVFPELINCPVERLLVEAFRRDLRIVGLKTPPRCRIGLLRSLDVRILLVEEILVEYWLSPDPLVLVGLVNVQLQPLLVHDQSAEVFHFGVDRHLQVPLEVNWGVSGVGYEWGDWEWERNLPENLDKLAELRTSLLDSQSSGKDPGDLFNKLVHHVNFFSLHSASLFWSMIFIFLNFFIDWWCVYLNSKFVKDIHFLVGYCYLKTYYFTYEPFKVIECKHHLEVAFI